MIAGCGGDSGDDDASDAGPAASVAYFDLSGDLATPARFFDFPFPSDLRLDADGRPDLRGFPNPKQIPLLDDLLLVAAERPGWPVMPVVQLRFTEPLAEQRETTVIPASADQAILLFDLDTRTLVPVVARTLAWDDFVAGWGLAIAPAPGIVLHAERRYAAVVTRALGDASGAPLGVAPAFAELAAGGTPDAPWGADAAALYADLWPALDALGVPRDQVAVATVFTTADVVARTAELADALAAEYDVAITGLALDSADGADHERFCELVTTVSFPQFQRGTPPFDEDGRFEYGDDGLPVLQRMEDAPLVILIPKTPMPPAGYPLLHYFHGSGGVHNEVVDRGRVSAESEPPPPGTGPGHVVAAFGIASAGTALPINPERVPGISPYAYINFQNLSALPYLFRQGVIEQRMLLDALLALEIDPTTLAGCDGPTLPDGATAFSFDAGAVLAQGQSMGGMYTNMIGATDPRVRAAVPTGAGGFWSFFILDTDLIQGTRELVGILFGTPFDELTFLHPAMHAITMAYEPADPFVYMPRLARRPLPGHPVRPVYEPVGKDDIYFRTELFDAAALAYGHHQAGDAVWPTMQPSLALAGLDGILPYPITDNATSADGSAYTGVVVQYADDGIRNAHYIYFQLDAVKYQAGCFFSTFLERGAATVPAPAPLGTPCP